MRWVLGYLSALCVLVLIISQSVIIPTFFMPFFRWHYNRPCPDTGLDIAETIGISHEDLMRVTTQLLDYMRGRSDTLEGITAEVMGRGTRGGRGSRTFGQNFFTDLEIRHMVDVRELYDILFIARNVAFFLLIALILGMILLKQNPLFLLSRCCREILVGFLALAAILAGIIAIDFDTSWTIFHHIFFDNDYWLLRPFVDLMINMFPLHFFLNISIFVGGLLLGFSAVIITAATVYLRQYNRPRY